MAGKNTSKQWILFMFISALAILLMAIGILDKDWILFVLRRRWMLGSIAIVIGISLLILLLNFFEKIQSISFSL